MTETETRTATWVYDREGGVTVTGPSSIINETTRLLIDTLRVMGLTDEQFQALLDEWWETQFTLLVTRRVEDGDIVYNLSVEDDGDMSGPVVVLAYILFEAQQGNAELSIEDVHDGDT